MLSTVIVAIGVTTVSVGAVVSTVKVFTEKVPGLLALSVTMMVQL